MDLNGFKFFFGFYQETNALVTTTHRTFHVELNHLIASVESDEKIAATYCGLHFKCENNIGIESTRGPTPRCV
jgi:hypothetical protein